MELQRWLTPGRIAGSDLGLMMFEGLHAGSWSPDEMLDLMLDTIRTFGNGCCYFLASAVARSSGRTVAGFWRVRDDDRLVHAVVVDQADGTAADVLGRRSLAEVREELADAVGGVRMGALPAIGGEMDADEVEILLEVAAGMPWMRVGRRAPTPDVWARIVREYAAGDMARRLR